MRWLVEVSSVERTDLQELCVEAESWQRALQRARAARGEDGPMSSFSVELFEDGYCAVDTLTHLRFVVKPAPDDMPATTPSADAIPPTNDAPSTASATSAPPPVGSPLEGLPAVTLLSSRAQDPTQASPLTYREYAFAVPAGTTEEDAVAALRGQLKLVDAHLAGTRMGKLVNLAAFDVEFSGKPPSPPIATLSWKDWKGEPVVGYPRRDAAERRAAPPPAHPEASAGPRSTLFPPPGSIPPAPLAPSVPPLASKPTPQGLFPVSPSSTPPANAPSTPPANASTPPPPANAPSVPPPPANAPSTPPANAPSVPPPPANAPSVPPPPANAPFTPPLPANAPSTPPANAPSVPPGTKRSQRPEPPRRSGSPPAPATPSAPPRAPTTTPAPSASVLLSASIPPPEPVTTPGPEPEPEPEPEPVNAPAAASASAAPPEPVTAPAAPHPPTTAPPPDGMVRTPSGRFVRGRTTGDELITSLFEAMHDLHFLRDALDGGQFCLALATEVLPARAALIHFFDVNQREWVVASTRGKDTAQLLTLRTPESDELLRDATRKRRAIVSPDGSTTARRYQALGGSRSMIIAPVMQAGRALGAIEIINPLDGMPFTDDEGHAMTYIAEQYAEYLGSRGIVLDHERIQRAAASR